MLNRPLSESKSPAALKRSIVIVQGYLAIDHSRYMHAVPVLPPLCSAGTSIVLLLLMLK